MVDKKKLGFVQGIDISFLTKEAQGWVYDLINAEGVGMTATQSAKLKEYGKDCELTATMVKLILAEEKPKERRVTIKSDKISEYFADNYSNEEIENIIYQLLDEWRSRQ